MTHIFIRKLNPLCCIISIFACLFQSLSFCCNSKYTAAICNNLSILEFGSGMETIISIFTFKVFKSIHWNALFVFYRISFTCKDHTYSRIILKFQLYLIQCSIHTGFHNFYNICFHSWKYNLCFRISKPCIIFQYLRSFCCKHQSKENNPDKWTTFCCHRIYCCLINVLFAKFVNFFCIKWTW